MVDFSLVDAQVDTADFETELSNQSKIVAYYYKVKGSI